MVTTIVYRRVSCGTGGATKMQNVFQHRFHNFINFGAIRIANEFFGAIFGTIRIANESMKFLSNNQEE